MSLSHYDIPSSHHITPSHPIIITISINQSQSLLVDGNDIDDVNDDGNDNGNDNDGDNNDDEEDTVVNELFMDFLHVCFMENHHRYFSCVDDDSDCLFLFFRSCYVD